MFACYGVKCLRINSLSIRRICVLNASRGDRIILDQLIIESAPRLETLLHFDEYTYHDLHVSVLSAPKLENLGFCSETTRFVFGSKDIEVTCIFFCTYKLYIKFAQMYIA